MTRARLGLTRPQILAFRRHAGGLDERLPPGQESLRSAAWAGLQDSMPRAALLSIHARVAGTQSSTWEDPSLVQLWGPRFSVFVVAACDLMVPDAARRSELWTPRVWPGGLLVAGELAGTWRRADTLITVQPWRPLSPAERDAVSAEAQSMPLPGAMGRIAVRWGD